MSASDGFSGSTGPTEASPKVLKPMTWTERPNDPSPGGYVRPSSWLLKGDWSWTIVVAPVTTPADPDWKSKVGSLEWNTSAELFNIHVGWKVAYWHWSVVKNGGLIGAGDVETREGAMRAAEFAVPWKRRKTWKVES